MGMDGKIRWVVSMRISFGNLLSSQWDIVSLRIEANGLDVAYMTRANAVLPFHPHHQSHGRDVGECQEKIGVEQK